MDWDAFNEKIIDEFRANGGVCGGMFEGARLLLLHHRGARSGIDRVAPLVYRPDGERWILFASKAGSRSNPGWYHNLMAHPETAIEIGTQTVEVLATEIVGAERDALFEAQKAEVPQFAEYESRTARTIPLVALTRR